MIAVVAAVVAILLLVPALVVLGRDSAEPGDALAPTTSTTTTAEASTSTTDPGSPPPDPTTTTTSPDEVVPPDPPLEAAIVDASAFVAEQRGLAFNEPVVGVRLPEGEFEETVREQLMEDTLAIEAEGAMLKLQGIIGPDVDYLSEYLATFPSWVGAYYDPVTDRIVARGEPGSPISLELELTLAHELTHALDYRTFDLASRVYDDPDTEQTFGLDALVEGDAMWIEEQWAQARGATLAPLTADSFSDYISSSTAVTYELGQKLVTDIVARGGQPELNTSFGDPPTTSEQIMHPEKYAVREPVVALDAPVADGKVLWTGVTGEHATGQMLRVVAPRELADRAAAGWGNDKGVLWVQPPSEGGLTCLRIAYAMDSPGDLAELDEAFALWARAAPDRTALLQGNSLIVTTCDDVPPPPLVGDSPT